MRMGMGMGLARRRRWMDGWLGTESESVSDEKLIGRLITASLQVCDKVAERLEMSSKIIQNSKPIRNSSPACLRVEFCTFSAAV